MVRGARWRPSTYHQARNAYHVDPIRSRLPRDRWRRRRDHRLLPTPSARRGASVSAPITTGAGTASLRVQVERDHLGYASCDAFPGDRLPVASLAAAKRWALARVRGAIAAAISADRNRGRLLIGCGDGQVASLYWGWGTGADGPGGWCLDIADPAREGRGGSHILSDDNYHDARAYALRLVEREMGGVRWEREA